MKLTISYLWAMLKTKSFTFNPFSENMFLVYDEEGACVIIDPGCYEQGEKDELDSFISNNDLKVAETF